MPTVREIAAQICGGEERLENMTFGERNKLIFDAIKRMTGYDVVSAAGPGYVAFKGINLYGGSVYALIDKFLVPIWNIPDDVWSTN